MDSILTLHYRAKLLRNEVDKKREEASAITQNSLNHGIAGDVASATAEANHALVIAREIVDTEHRAVEVEKQLLAVEQRILELLQHAMVLRDENIHHVTYIDHDTKQKLDEITREVHALRG